MNTSPGRRPPTRLTRQEGGETREDDAFEQQLAKVFSMDAFDADGQADIFVFMNGRFKPGGRPGGPRPTAAARGPAGQFTGAAKSGGGFRAAGVAPRLPLRDRADLSCVNCGRKGHMESTAVSRGSPECRYLPRSSQHRECRKRTSLVWPLCQVSSRVFCAPSYRWLAQG